MACDPCGVERVGLVKKGGKERVGLVKKGGKERAATQKLAADAGRARATARRKAGVPTATRVAEQLQGDTGQGRASARTEELRFKVTPDVRQRFKRAAKDLGLKKGEFLERLMAAWQAAGMPPAVPARSEKRPAEAASAGGVQAAEAGSPRRRTKP